MRVSAFVAALVILTVFAAGTNAADPRFQRQKDDPIARARQQRDALKAQIATQQTHLADLTASSQQLGIQLETTTDSLNGIMVDLATATAQVQLAENELAATEARRDALQSQVDALDYSLDIMAGQADELARDLAERRRELGARLADAYRASKTSMLDQVMTSGSFLDALIQQQGALALGEHDRDLATSIQRDQQLLDQQRRELQHMRYDTQQLHDAAATAALQITAQRDALTIDKARLAALQARTAQLQADQQAKLAKLITAKASAKALLLRQQAASTHLSKRIKMLIEKERHAGRLPSVFNGTLRWPLIADISQEFGCTGVPIEPPVGDCPHFHGGIDIVGKYGSKIAAAGDGVVLVAGWNPAVPRDQAPFIVVIAHSDSLVTIYGHLQARLPKKIHVGAHVKEGQLIGWEGNTGITTGPHLHWAVQLNGDLVNPRYFL